MVTRITGLASGMDIDSMVENLMRAERTPLDKLNQKKQRLEWQRDSYRDINKKLEEFSKYVFDNMILSTNYNKKTVSSSDTSKVTAKAVNAENNVTTQIKVGNLATASTYKSTGTINYTAGSARTLTFNVTKPGETKSSPVSIKISSSDTLDQVVSKINSSGLGVTAMKENIKNAAGDYVETIALTSNATGAGGVIQAADSATASFMSDQLGFTLDASNNLTASTEGVDAVITFNGLEMKKSSNTFNVNGVEYTLTGVTGIADTDTPVTISTATDVDGIYDSIKEFVDKYNELVDEINSKLNENKYRDYQPLTDEQKKAMSEDEIKLWEEKAKSGLLRNDSILSGSTNAMRAKMYESVSVNGQTLQLAEFGITTTSIYSLRGHLEIDEDKLKEKIAEDPQAVVNLFKADGVTSGEKGIARRLRETLEDTVNQIEKKAGNSGLASSQYILGKSLSSVENSISDMENRLKDIENRYYNKFTALETAIQKMNSQSEYISQMFSAS
ncbi:MULTISPECIES: flagellar hook-associated protein 2 [Bacillus]|uniref:flagellar hook-associated protein 2 n=1 Tax=Bacillus TaxID=1386 RepID=UPI0004027DDB|nr:MULTISPECIES: flagellar hook-associated protein 2 [Bacillus]QHZ45434.1 flagellar hook-associated protein 2 [Bacillus sp. NSP9.1]WFA04766.1 flagellar hook-associated protein 2 [Bacillus sp. HSf4]